MLKIKEQLNSRVYHISEGESDATDICIEGYILDNGVSVQYIKCKWLDFNDNEYTPVYNNDEIIGFVK